MRSLCAILIEFRDEKMPSDCDFRKDGLITLAVDTYPTTSLNCALKAESFAEIQRLEILAPVLCSYVSMQANALA